MRAVYLSSSFLHVGFSFFFFLECLLVLLLHSLANDMHVSY